ncbi:MAG: LPS export ABC transporter permease LptG [Burkholderiaceae bacterium]|nr:LPS export ABC transporter permease LptG [Burkholderiaceae bacterium]
MKTIGRYLRREIVAAVIFVLTGFLALFAFFDFINELEDTGRGGYEVQHAVAIVALSLPGRVYELMPIAALIGTIFALSQFAAHSEFTAMRASGLGRRQALAAIASVGAWFALATAGVGELVTPQAEKLAQTVRLGALGGAVGGQFRSGLWVKDTVKEASGATQRTRFVNIAELAPDASLRGVRVFEFDRDLRLLEILHARRGRFEPPSAWRLEAVERTVFSPVSVAGSTVALRAERSRLNEMRWASELNPDLIGVLVLVPERMSAWSLVQYVRHLRDNQQRANRYEIALWKKLVYPLAVIVMMALALPFGYLQVRAGGTGYKVFAGIMLGIAFHFLNSLFSHLGLLNTWPAWLAAGVPSLFAVALALGMLAWVDRAR